MTNILDSFDTGKPQANRIARGIVSRLDEHAEHVFAILPDFNRKHEFGPMPFEHAGEVTIGDAILVSFDEQGTPWVVSWDGVASGTGGASTVFPRPALELAATLGGTTDTVITRDSIGGVSLKPTTGAGWGYLGIKGGTTGGGGGAGIQLSPHVEDNVGGWEMYVEDGNDALKFWDDTTNTDRAVLDAGGLTLTDDLDVGGDATIHGNTVTVGSVTVYGPSSALIARDKASAPTWAWVSSVTGDSVDRFRIQAGGKIEFGSGSAATDTTIERTGVGELTVGSTLKVTTPSPGDNSTKVATTAFVTAAITGAAAGLPVYNVVSSPYNADSTGATTATTAVAAAITAANGAGGGIVYFPPGTYRIKNVDILDNVMVVCAPGVTFKLPSSGLANFDRMWYVGQGTRRNKIRFYGNGCVLDATGSYGGSVTVIAGMVIEAAADFVIDGMHSTAFAGGNLLALNATSGGDHCERGHVSNLKDTGRTDGGYGVVQVTGAKYVTFDNLYTSGGNCLNIESDRRTGGADMVTDIEARNLYAEGLAGQGGPVFKIVAHDHQIARIKVRGARSVNSPGNGIYFASMWDQGGTLPKIKDVLVEDVLIESPTGAGVKRENGYGEYDDIEGVVFRRVRVTGSASHGWMLGMSCTLDDCQAIGNTSSGFTINSTSGSVGPLPYYARFTNCLAQGNGDYGFINYEQMSVWELFRCRSELNGIRAYTSSGDTYMRVVEEKSMHGQSGWYADTGNHTFSDADNPEYLPRIIGPWSKDNVAASQTNVALATLDPPGAAGAVNTVKMPRSGTILGIFVKVRNYADGRTAGTLTVECLKNGSALGTPLTAVLNATNPLAKYTNVSAVGAFTYVEDDTIGVRVTTDGSWAPTTADIDVYVVVADVPAWAPLASPALTGNPTAPTPSTSDNDTSIATTAFVKAALPFVKVGSVVAAGGETSLSVGSIPSGYQQLLFVYKARKATGSGAESLSLRFNGDTSNVYYDAEYDYVGATLAAHTVSSPATSGRFGRAPGADASSGAFSTGYVLVPDYSNAAHAKNWIGKTSSFETAGMVGEEDVGCWYNSAAITSVAILGSGFAAGSRLDVYAIV